MLVLRVARGFDRARLPCALVGGFAVALHGAVRGTVGVDLVIRFRGADFLRAEKTLNALGLQSRLPVTASEVFRFREEYVRNRNLRAWTFVSPSLPLEIAAVPLPEALADMHLEEVTIEHALVRAVSIADRSRRHYGPATP